MMAYNFLPPLKFANGPMPNFYPPGPETDPFYAPEPGAYDTPLNYPAEWDSSLIPTEGPYPQPNIPRSTPGYAGNSFVQRFAPQSQQWGGPQVPGYQPQDQGQGWGQEPVDLKQAEEMDRRERMAQGLAVLAETFAPYGTSKASELLSQFLQLNATKQSNREKVLARQAEAKAKGEADKAEKDRSNLMDRWRRHDMDVKKLAGLGGYDAWTAQFPDFDPASPENFERTWPSLKSAISQAEARQKNLEMQHKIRTGIVKGSYSVKSAGNLFKDDPEWQQEVAELGRVQEDGKTLKRDMYDLRMKLMQAQHRYLGSATKLNEEQRQEIDNAKEMVGHLLKEFAKNETDMTDISALGGIAASTNTEDIMAVRDRLVRRNMEIVKEVEDLYGVKIEIVGGKGGSRIKPSEIMRPGGDPTPTAPVTTPDDGVRPQSATPATNKITLASIQQLLAQRGLA